MRLVMEASGLAWWPSVSLLVFFSACLGMLAWIYRPGSRALYRELGAMAVDGTPEAQGSETQTPKLPEN
jgi:hypothetical protein